MMQSQDSPFRVPSLYKIEQSGKERAFATSLASKLRRKGIDPDQFTREDFDSVLGSAAKDSWAEAQARKVIKSGPKIGF